MLIYQRLNKRVYGIWFAFAPTSLVFGFAPTERCGRGKCEPAVGANVNDMVFAWQAQEMSGPKHVRNGNAAAKKAGREC